MIAMEETAKSTGRNYSTGSGADPGAGSALRIEQSLDYMAANLDRPLQVATLAALAGLSPSHFFALFKQHKGCPPMDYFTRLRMRRACELFDSTAASVKEVAAALGFDDQFYFSRLFKSVNGVSPRGYCLMTSELKYAPKTSATEPKNLRSSNRPNTPKTCRTNR
jgi:transcriptional regulator GlxA family with amidase domain